MATVEENLRKAADLIRKYGWGQGVRIDCFGNLCILGAVAMAITGNAYGEVIETPEYQELESRLNGRVLWAWNDGWMRTKEEVINLLEGGEE